MKRIVQPELLDALPANDPHAVRSRRDLCRVNVLMRHPAIVARALQNLFRNNRTPETLLELGAGDAQFLIRVAHELAPHWPSVKVTLLDQQNIISKNTLAEFAQLGWSARVLTCDVRAWANGKTDTFDVIVANLFLHHFEDNELARLLRAIAARTKTFVAAEPRRAAWPLLCSRLVWIIGCNAVTSYDARVSVHAGFNGREISALWPQHEAWDLMELPTGAFSHLFTARRKS